MSGLIYHVDKRRVLPQIERPVNYRNSKLPLDLMKGKNDVLPDIIYKDENLYEKIKQFEKEQSKKLASEILSIASVNDEKEKIPKVLKYLNDKFPEDKILKFLTQTKINEKDCSKRINHNRQKLLLEPKDAITWTDQAINFIQLGLREKALKSIRTAVSLDKNNTIILRNASRIFNLCGDNSEAIRVLKKSEYYKYDPQLLASEIAFSQLENRKSQGPQLGQKIIKSKSFNNYEISELASSLGTSEFFQGNLRKSEDLFDLSLVNPNRNSFAQSLWYKQSKIPDEEYNTEILSSEIKTHIATKANDFIDSLRYSKEWISDEPFSTRPYSNASYISGVLMDDYDDAISLEKINYKNQELIKGKLDITEDYEFRNDLAYFYLKNGNIEKAGNYLSPILKNIMNKSSHQFNDYFMIATLGLYSYKTGDVDSARKFYRKSIKYFMSKGKTYNARSAFYNFFMEEIEFENDIEKLMTLKRELDDIIPINAQNDILFLKNKALKKVENKMRNGY